MIINEITEHCRIQISDIRIASEFQVRTRGLDQEHVDDLVDAIREDPSSVPPVVVSRLTTQEGTSCDATYLLLDGFHRCEAYRKLELNVIPARVVGDFSESQALVYVLENVNRHTAKKLSTCDKRQIVLDFLMMCPEEIDSSHNELARKLGFSAPFVAKVINNNQARIESIKQRFLLSRLSHEDLIEALCASNRPLTHEQEDRLLNWLSSARLTNNLSVTSSC